MPKPIWRDPKAISDYVRWRLRGSPIAASDPRPTIDDWLSVFRHVEPPTSLRREPLHVLADLRGSEGDVAERLLHSLGMQTTDAREVTLVVDAGVSIDSGDDRVHIVELGSTERLDALCAAATAGIGTGHLLIVIGDAVLEPTALSWFAAASVFADFVYADDLVVGPTGDDELRFKPAWSPTLARSMPYLGQVVCAEGRLVARSGGLGMGTPEDLRRIAGAASKVAHVPHALSRVGEAPIAIPDGIPGVPHRTHARGTRPLVRVVIPTRDRVDLLSESVDAVLRSGGIDDLELVIVDNGSTDEATLAFLADLAARDHRVDIVRDDLPFNFSRLCNAGARHGHRTDVIVFLNNDIASKSPDWLARLTSWLDDDGVGAAGPALVFGDGRVQHIGLVIGRDQFQDDPGVSHVPLAAHPGHGLDSRSFAGTVWGLPREVSGLTAACLAVRTEDFEAVAGFDEQLGVDFQDVDLCLKIVRRGRRLIIDPSISLVHHESASRGTIGASAPATLRLMAERWDEALATGDPFFSPHLGLDLTMRSVEGLTDAQLVARLMPRVVDA